MGQLFRRHCALSFLSGWLYRDGNANGITHEDIRRGIDRPMGSRILFDEARAFIGIPAAVTRDPMGKPLDNENPVKFGRGDILTFGPLATATPGSLYIREASGTVVWAFRVSGLGGRVRVFRWFKGQWKRWE